LLQYTSPEAAGLLQYTSPEAASTPVPRLPFSFSFKGGVAKPAAVMQTPSKGATFTAGT
jgi:hypothetical protein